MHSVGAIGGIISKIFPILFYARPTSPLPPPPCPLDSARRGVVFSPGVRGKTATLLRERDGEGGGGAIERPAHAPPLPPPSPLPSGSHILLGAGVPELLQ